MRIHLSSGSSSEGSDEDENQQAGPSQIRIGAQSPLARTDKVDDQPEAPSAKIPSTLALQGTARRRSHHLERINALRRTSPGVDDSSRQDEHTRRRSSGPSWMQMIDEEGEKGASVRRSEQRKRVTFASREQGRYRAPSRIDSNDSHSSASSTSDKSDDEDDGWTLPTLRRVPTAANRIAGRRMTRESSVEAQIVSSSIRLASDEAQPRARSISSMRLTSPVSVRPRGQDAITSSRERSTQPDDFDEVQKLLHRMRIQKQDDETQERQAFEARNKNLWDSIEKGIQEAERAREAAVKEEQERARRAREQQEAAERRAREAQEAEEKRQRDAQAAEERKKQEAQKIAKEKAANDAKAEQDRAAAEAREKSAGGIGDGLVGAARLDYEKWASKMAHIKQNVLPAVANNAEWRKQCFTAKRQITRGIGQLTNSLNEVIRITRSINEVLAQARGASPGGEIYTWILNHLSKCLIRQAEQETAAKQDTAFPLARVAVWLMLEGHTEFGDVLFARLNKKCCWVLAFFPGKKAGEDEASYSKRLGKASVEESSQQHVARMSGIIAMYFAIAQTSLSAPPASGTVDKERIPPQFRVSALWTWQARAMAPSFLEHALTPALWSVLLEIAGPRLLLAYGRQTGKVWRLLHQEGLRNGKAGFTKNVSANSARVRLQLLLEDWSQSGRVENCTPGREMKI